jgi:hypothetical protein
LIKVLLNVDAENRPDCNKLLNWFLIRQKVIIW